MAALINKTGRRHHLPERKCGNDAFGKDVELLPHGTLVVPGWYVEAIRLESTWAKRFATGAVVVDGPPPLVVAESVPPLAPPAPTSPASPPASRYQRTRRTTEPPTES